MSPSVITSVALAPRLRIDDTGLPISTSRVSTVPRIGARIVALASSSAARSAAALACATCARGLGHLRLADRELRLRGALAVLRLSSALCASSSADCAIELLLEQRLRRARRRGARTRRPALRPRPRSSCSCASAPSSAARAACRLASAPRRAARAASPCRARRARRLRLTDADRRRRAAP